MQGGNWIKNQNIMVLLLMTLRKAGKNAEDASNKGKLHKDIEAFYNDIEFHNDTIN